MKLSDIADFQKDLQHHDIYTITYILTIRK